MNSRIIDNFQEIKELVLYKNLIDLKPIFPELKSLKPKGKLGNMTMTCPFHQEKTPSFVWISCKGFFYCFGCGIGGDIISYYIERKNVSFIEAIIRLSKFFKIKIEWKTIHSIDRHL